MDRIMQLNAVTYMMKDAIKGQRRNMGFLAQNVAALFPQIVSHHMPGGDDLLGLDYSGFGVIAIKGIQEEQAKIETLESGVSDMEYRLQAIEKKLGIVSKQNLNVMK
jgi:trimeric autotransporter adhesin